MKKFLQLAAVAAAATLAVTGCAGADQEASAQSGGITTLEISVFGTGIPSRELNAAEEQGYLEEAGLKVTTRDLTNPAAALTAGEIDLGYVSYASALPALGAGIPLELAVGMRRAADQTQSLWVAKTSDIDSVEDLKGKTVGTTTRVGYGSVLYGEALAEHGLTLEDIDFLELKFADMPTALLRGDIDVAWLPSPYAAAERAKGDASKMRQLLDFNDVASLQNDPEGGIVATPKFIDENPEVIEALRGAIAKGGEYLAENPDYDRELQLRLGKFEEATAAELPLPPLAMDVEVKELEDFKAMMEKYGVLEAGNKADMAAFLGQK